MMMIKSKTGKLGVLLVAVALAVAFAGVASATGGESSPDPSEFATQANVVVPGSAYYPLNPARVLDTRFGVGGVQGPVGPGQSFSLAVRGVAGVPADANAVVMNVTAAYASELSFITVWPTGSAMPEASSLNPSPGLIAPNSVTSQIGGSGQVSFFNAAGSVQLVGDVVGYYKAITVPSPDTYVKTAQFDVPVAQNSTVNVLSSYGVLPSSNYQGTYSVSASLAPSASLTCSLSGDYNGTIVPFGGSTRTVGNSSGVTAETSFSVSVSFPITVSLTPGILLRCSSTGGAATVRAGTNLLAEQVNIQTL